MIVLALLLAIITNQDIITLTRAGLPPNVIITKITTSEHQFDTSVNALLALKAAKVDDTVISAMLHPAPTPAAPSPVLPPVRFGEIFIDLPGIKTSEGTLTISSTGITYTAKTFGTITIPAASIRSVCYEEAYYGSLYVRVASKQAITGDAAPRLTGTIILFKYTRAAVRPAYEYLKRALPAVAEDCSDEATNP